jgi:hypothetical protein
MKPEAISKGIFLLEYFEGFPKPMISRIKFPGKHRSSTTKRFISFHQKNSLRGGRKMKREILKNICFPLFPLIFLYLIMATISFAQTKESPRGALAVDELLGKWSGTWERPPNSKLRGQDLVIEVEKIDPDKNISEITYSWSETRIEPAGNAKIKAKYIPPDRLEWYSKGQYFYQFRLKDGILWGTKTKGNSQQKITMTKLKE